MVLNPSGISREHPGFALFEQSVLRVSRILLRVTLKCELSRTASVQAATWARFFVRLGPGAVMLSASLLGLVVRGRDLFVAAPNQMSRG